MQESALTFWLKLIITGILGVAGIYGLQSLAAFIFMYPIQVPPIFWLVSFGLLGAMLGSYVNMAAYRLPRNISTVTRSRSFCPSCEHQLAWYDNLPLLSYLSLFGKCRYCSKPIGVRYFVVEVIVAALFIASTYQFFVLNVALTWSPTFSGMMHPIVFAVQLFLIVDLVLLSVVDLETWLIPVETTFPWILAGVILAPIFPELHGAATHWSSSIRVDAFIDSLMGLILGAGVPWSVGFLTTAVSFFYYKLKGRPDRPLEGMGGGDAHLLAMIGAMLGWKAALITAIFGFFIGAISGVAKILWDKRQQRILGDKWKPWQPTYELPPGPELKPVFWPLLVMGMIVFCLVAVLFDQAPKSLGHADMRTLEEVQAHFMAGAPFRFDTRMISVWLMAILCAMLFIAFAFFKYLQSINMLPQGDITENDKGEKQEVMKGNYIPFGPSLALAGLIVVFWGPLIRNLMYWQFVQGGEGSVPRTPFRLLGQEVISTVVVTVVNWFNGTMHGLMESILSLLVF
jgi:leader peptidase (prepilin peptidase) / N-methyltransferase